MTVTINLPVQLARELQTIVQVRIMSLHAEYDRALQRKDSNQHALLNIIRRQRNDAYDLQLDISQAIRNASPSTETETA